MAEVIMYSMRTCPTCDRARREMTEDGIDFEERVIEDKPEWFEEASGLAVTVPIIVRGDQIEVGWKGESG